MYYKSSEVSKEEIQAEEKEQRDAEVYSNLKTALQNRLYDVILNWNLFAPPYEFSLFFFIILDKSYLFYLPHFKMLKNIFDYILLLFFKKCKLKPSKV